jgi:beta-glucuronidase
MASPLRCLTIAMAMLIAVGESRAQVAPLIANIGGRSTTNLNGQWQAIVDPYDVGFVDYRAQPMKNNSAFFKNYKPKSKSELIEYDFDTTGHLNVPGDWNTQRDSLLFYEGSVWYERSFDFAKSPKKRLFVTVGEVGHLHSETTRL